MGNVVTSSSKQNLASIVWAPGRTRRSTRLSRGISNGFTSAAPNRLRRIRTSTPTSLLDAYLFVEDAEALFAEYGACGVAFTRGLDNTPWDSREFVVKDCDGRLLAFGADPK
jgi:hypothetical protein